MQNMTDRNTVADKRRIGIFGGAFNPVHNGHISLVKGYLEDLRLDEVIMIPTANPPHKSDEDLIGGEDRIRMLTLATANIPKISISDMEFHREGKSYTYLTLQEIRAQAPDSELFLLIGADQLLHFHQWYHYRDILAMVTLCAQARESEEERQRLRDYAASLDGLERFFLSDRPVYTVSSSDIRQRLRDGEEVSALLPPGVYDYIKEKGLYIESD